VRDALHKYFSLAMKLCNLLWVFFSLFSAKMTVIFTLGPRIIFYSNMICFSVCSPSPHSHSVWSQCLIYINLPYYWSGLLSYGLLTRRHLGSFFSRGTTETSHSCSTFQSRFLIYPFRFFFFLQNFGSSSFPFFFHWASRSANGNNC
jgi:hypothetical protein